MSSDSVKLQKLLDSDHMLITDRNLLSCFILTTLALQILQTHFNSKKSEWDLVNQKARNWISDTKDDWKQIGVTEAELDKLQQQVKELVAWDN